MSDTPLRLYKNLTQKERLYLRLRYIISPIVPIEALVPREGRVYDVGCGAGLLSNVLALRSEKRHVTGVDISPEKIGIAQKSLNKRKNIRFIIGDILAFAFDSPDAIVMCDLLHHIPFSIQENIIRHIYSSLNKGGQFILQEIDKKPLHKYLFALVVDKLINRISVYYRRNKDLRSILRNTGFEVEVMRIDKGYPIAAVAYRCVK